MDLMRFYSQFFPDRRVEGEKRLRFLESVVGDPVAAREKRHRFLASVFKNSGLLDELDALKDIREDIDRILYKSQDFNVAEAESLINRLAEAPDSAEKSVYIQELIDLYENRTGLEY